MKAKENAIGTSEACKDQIHPAIAIDIGCPGVEGLAVRLVWD